jgi:hypothetical protein
VQPGFYHYIVEGCDVSWTGSHTCRQGWTFPIDVRVAPDRVGVRR